MEQATNQFTKGLQMDTHPMVQGNDTLTDCLNGTLITMNGDEVILQNDMGNRRVDNAYLPAGFEPIGIKEYGGIIYVAAYNPITNQSQIGCFPSPQRRYVGDNNGKEIGLSEAQFNFYEFGTKNNKTVYALTSDTILTRLIDKPICPGDKFLTVIDDNYSDQLSNWNASSPYQNKKYTLSYGVLNSQNQFVDITKNLMRWDGNSIVANSGNTDEDFNTGYFLPTSCPTNVSNNIINTITDQTFDEQRLKLEMNTYSGKLVGYPYAKLKLNHPESFSYSYKGIKNDDNSAKLIITGTIEYNSPVGTEVFYLFKNSSINIDIKPIKPSKPSVSPILMAPRSGNTVSQNVISNQEYYNQFQPHYLEHDESSEVINTYNENLKIFTSTIKKTYNIINTSSKLEGYLTVPIWDDSDYLVGDLIQPISIDPNLFGTNTLELDNFGWKVYESLDGESNVIKTLRIRYNLNNYLDEDNEIYKIKIVFQDLTSTDSREIETDLNTQLGGVDINIPNLQDRHYYSVVFRYSIKSDENNFKEVRGGNNLWLLNTPLLNDCYTYGENSNYIRNYCNRTTKENNIFKKLTKIQYNITETTFTLENPVEVDDNENEIGNNEPIDITNFFKEDKSGFNLRFKHNVKSLIHITKNVQIENLENYPINIGVPSLNLNLTGSTLHETFLDTIYIKNQNRNLVNDEDLLKIFTNIELYENENQNYIKLISTFYDFFISDTTGNKQIVKTSKCLHPINGLIEEMVRKYLCTDFGPIIHCIEAPQNSSVNYYIGTSLSNTGMYKYREFIGNNYYQEIQELNENDKLNVSSGYVGYDETIMRTYNNEKEACIGIRRSSYPLLNPPVIGTHGSSPRKNNQQGNTYDNLGLTNFSEPISTICHFTNKIEYPGNSTVQPETDITEDKMSSDYTYVYINSVVLPNLIINNCSEEHIINLLNLYFKPNNKRIYIHNEVPQEMYTVNGAMIQAEYTNIPPDNNNGRKPVVDIKIGYEVTHDIPQEYTNISNKQNLFFTKSQIEDDIRSFTLNIKSFQSFLTNVNTSGINLEMRDLGSGASPINGSFINQSNNGKVYEKDEDLNYGYSEVSNMKTFSHYGKLYPMFKALQSDYNKTYCYIYGPYSQPDDNYTKSIYFYYDFTQFGIQNADVDPIDETELATIYTT